MTGIGGLEKASWELNGTKDKVDEIRRLVSTLYNYYVPPFKVQTYPIPEDAIKGTVVGITQKASGGEWLRLDGTYYTASLDDFKKIISWDWTNLKKYVSDTFDCDKFALYFKSRIALDFKINAVAVVLDYSSEHAYNLIIYREGEGFNWILYEPQNDSMFYFEQRDTNFYKMEDYILLL